MSSTHSHSIAHDFEQKFSGSVFAHKLSGTALEDPDIRGEVLRGIQELMNRNIRCLLVSGAGPTLDKALGTKYAHPGTHLRITPKKDIPHIEAAIRKIGEVFSTNCQALGIPFEVLPHSVSRATRLLNGHKETGGIDFMDQNAIQEVLDRGKLAILPFGGMDHAGNTLNVNADDVAARAAAAVHAVKLIMYTNEEGIMVPGKNGKLKKADFLDFNTLFHLMREKNDLGEFVIGKGMVPKIRAIMEALMYGVPQVHVVQAKTRALLEEIFTRTGSGTLIEKEPFLMLDFPARYEQLKDILKIREECSTATTPSGVPFLKPLSIEQLRELLPTTIVLRQRKMIVGTVHFKGLEGYHDTALVGGLAIGENHQHSGYGRLLLESVLEQIGEHGFMRVVSITAAEPVKNLFKEYGKEASTDWLDLLGVAQKRYGPDEHLVSLYTFDIPPPDAASSEN